MSSQGDSGQWVTDGPRDIKMPTGLVCNAACCLCHSSCHAANSAGNKSAEAINFVEQNTTCPLLPIQESLLVQFRLIDLVIQLIELNCLLVLFWLGLLLFRACLSYKSYNWPFNGFNLCSRLIQILCCVRFWASAMRTSLFQIVCRHCAWWLVPILCVCKRCELQMLVPCGLKYPPCWHYSCLFGCARM